MKDFKYGKIGDLTDIIALSYYRSKIWELERKCDGANILYREKLRNEILRGALRLQEVYFILGETGKGLWFNGRMCPWHGCGPGSIPGRSI
jgi:hypothetical protein